MALIRKSLNKNSIAIKTQRFFNLFCETNKQKDTIFFSENHGIFIYDIKRERDEVRKI